VRRKKVKKNFIKKFLRDKRAITPVLSHLLLTVVAVAIMSLATSATFVITTNLRQTMGERVVVEDVWFNSAVGTVDVFMRNVGKADIQVSGVYVNHVGQSFNGGASRLEVNKHGWLRIAYSWGSEEAYYIDIVTNRGTHIASYYKAP
jgi:FlaG/FlaF family flagellin (archaellin)